LWILRGFEFVSAKGVTSIIRFLLKKSVYSYAGFVLVNCTTDLFIVRFITVIYSELHSFGVGKTVLGDSRKIRPRQPFVSQTSRKP